MATVLEGTAPAEPSPCHAERERNVSEILRFAQDDERRTDVRHYQHNSL
ncbi:MAG: hypothetical protein NZ741_11410 [Armatimonadetes bacterium]|nr:hypothetical protein [Armatimonadota bacterium]